MRTILATIVGAHRCHATETVPWRSEELRCSAFTLSQRGPHDENGSTVDSGFDLPAPAPGH